MFHISLSITLIITLISELTFLFIEMWLLINTNINIKFRLYRVVYNSIYQHLTHIRINHILHIHVYQKGLTDIGSKQQGKFLQLPFNEYPLRVYYFLINPYVVNKEINRYEIQL